jgi:hypothetical protein
MQVAAFCHIELVVELNALQAEMSFATELVLGRSPNEPFQVEIMKELCSWLERPGARICTLLLGLPPS